MKRSARPSFARTPDRCRAISTAMQARLYELIWKRAVASQMESAELERTTVDVVSADKQDHAARHRHGHACSTASSRSTRKARTTRTTKTAPSCPRWRTASRSTVEKVTPEQHFTEPPPRYSEASLVKQAGRARHRPALDLCLDPLDLARPRLCEDGPQPLHSRRQGPARHHLPHQFLQPLCRNTTSPPIWKRSSTRSRTASSSWKAAAARFLEGFLGRDRRDQGPQDLAGHHRARRDPGPAHLPAGGGRRRSAQMPHLRQRPARSEARTFRRLRRLLELSRMPLHPPDRTSGRRSRQRAAAGAGQRSRNGRADHAAQRPLRSLRAARRRREAATLRHSQGHRPIAPSISNMR